MSEAKKWVKHTPRETPKTKRERALQVPKVVMPLIPDETIEALRSKYSVPHSGAASEIDPRYLEIWNLTCEIKGYLTKRAVNKDAIGLHVAIWPDLRMILDQAIAANDPKIFAYFAKAWESAEVGNNSPPVMAKPGDYGLAAAIDSLIPNSSTNPPNSPISLQILNSIEGLQGRLKRASTNAEVVLDSKNSKDGGSNKQEVSRQIGRMGLRDLMSKH